MAGAAFGAVGVSLLVMLQCHCSWQAQHLVMSGASPFVAGAAFGDVAVSLFLAGAAFADVAAFRGSCSVTFRGRRSIW